MLDDEPTNAPSEPTASSGGDGSAEPAAPRKTTRRRKATAAPADAVDATDAPPAGATPAGDGDVAPKKTAAPRKRTTKKAAASAPEVETAADAGAPIPATAVIFQAPEPVAPAKAAKKSAAKKTTAKKTAAKKTAEAPPEDAAIRAEAGGEHPTEAGPDGEPGGSEPAGPTGNRRRRGRRGRGRGGAGEGAGGDGEQNDADDAALQSGDADSTATDGDSGDESGEDGDPTGTGARRRRRRRRRGAGGGTEEVVVDDDGVETVVHVREPKPKAPRAPRQSESRDADDDVKGVKGSTRLEAKRQRRRDGRDTSRRRPPIITESEFLARRESVDRVMVVRQGPERTQIGVLEDGVLVEHYVARKDHASMVGNVYLGKVQNVLPSMEAAFVDIGRGRNAVLYAGEVNYDASALEGRPPRIEQALKSGQSVLVQVTKDPIGHKGARLTSQVSLAGRYMVYVPDGRLSGISRKLPDTERSRLKGILKRLTPDEAGVIIRTAAEGASEEDLERDLNRLQAQWEDIDKKAQTASAPAPIYGEPDVVIRVIRDIFNEDFTSLVVSGDDEWDTVDNYVRWVAPDLAERATKWTEDRDVFAAYRIDEQLAKALDRKVWLPSGGYLVIDRTEAMIVVDVNTGKFTGKGGNLEETVTKNNIEAAEEIVRQLRLRDIGGIIVIDFIDMVLESNRDLVLRRLMECLGRDRTRHQVAEVTSLGLVQMTRKRVGQGLRRRRGNRRAAGPRRSAAGPRRSGRGVAADHRLLSCRPGRALRTGQHPPGDRHRRVDRGRSAVGLAGLQGVLGHGQLLDE